VIEIARKISTNTGFASGRDGDAHDVEIVDYHWEGLKEVLADAELTINALAFALRVPGNRIGGIVKGQRGTTGDTSLRLARYFGASAQMWR